MKVTIAIGEVFGRLTVVDFEGVDRHHHRRWLCRCKCGKEIVTETGHLRSGHTQSCGCLQSEDVAKRNGKHGEAGRLSKTKEYRAWLHMVERCTNPKMIDFRLWGGRGIQVCNRWRASFENFLEDVGRAPSSRHSIDRFPDNNGNYELGNVRWATPREQSLNTRRNIKKAI